MSGYDRREQSRGGMPAAPWPGAGGVGSATPTPQELMMYADGELDPHRAVQVGMFLQAHPDQRAKLARTHFAAQLLVGEMLVKAEAAGADRIADAVMASIGTESRLRVVGARRNGSSRSSWVARTSIGLSITLAVAAVCTLWARAVIRHRIGGQLAVESSKASETTLPDRLSAIKAPIKIDAVDFGARAGTIFYVKTDGDKTGTPVLWVNDDDAGVDGGGKR